METSFDEIIKSCSQTNNDGLKAVFYKYFSNEAAAAPWKVPTMGVTSRTEIISTINKKVKKRDICIYINICI